MAFAADDPEELYRKGLQLLAEHRAEAAVEALRGSLALRPGHAATWKALGVAYAEGGDYAAAEQPFHRACLLNSGEPDACLYFGRTLYLLDRFEEALDVLAAARKTDPSSAQIRRIEALTLEAMGRTAEAETAFREAIRLERNSALNEDPAIDYGVFLLRQGNAEQAVRPLSEAVERHPNAARAQLELGCVLLALDRVQEATLHLEIAAKADSPRAHLLLGKAYARLGRTDEARRESERAAAKR
jgi:Flp pilus assembly protein TadD